MEIVEKYENDLINALAASDKAYPSHPQGAMGTR